MRIGIVGLHIKWSLSSNLADCLNGSLGQTAYKYEIDIYPEEYKFRWHKGHPGKRFPLSKMINGTDLEYIIVIQGCLDIHNDMDIPVLYFHREPERGLGIDRFDILALKYPNMLRIQELRDFDNKFILLPCTHPPRWKHDLPKDLLIADVCYGAPIGVYKDLMKRSSNVLIHTHPLKYNREHWGGVAVRALDALACKAIPVLFVEEREEAYRDMGFNESNCYFNELPKTYDLKMVEAGQKLLAKHSVLERAKQILEVIKNV